MSKPLVIGSNCEPYGAGPRINTCDCLQDEMCQACKERNQRAYEEGIRRQAAALGFYSHSERDAAIQTLRQQVENLEVRLREICDIRERERWEFVNRETRLRERLRKAEGENLDLKHALGMKQS